MPQLPPKSKDDMTLKVLDYLFKEGYSPKHKDSEDEELDLDDAAQPALVPYPPKKPRL